MIRKIVLGLVLTSMVTSPLNAMQAMRRVASMRALSSVSRSGLQLNNQVPRIVRPAIQQTAALSWFGKKKEQPKEKIAWSDKPAGMFTIIAGGLAFLFGNNQLELMKEQEKQRIAEKSFVKQMPVLLLDEFKELYAERQKEILVTIVRKNKLSEKEQLFITDVCKDEDAKELHILLKTVYNEQIDFLNLEACDYVFFKQFIYKFFKALPEDKQINIIKKLLNKTKMLNNERLFLSDVYATELQSIVYSVAVNEVDFYSLHRDRYQYFPRTLLVSIFNNLPAQNQLSIVKHIAHKKTYTTLDSVFIDDLYTCANQQLKATMRSVFGETISFYELDRSVHMFNMNIAEDIFEKLSKDKQKEIADTLSKKPGERTINEQYFIDKVPKKESSSWFF